MRPLLTLLTLAAFLPACTRSVPRAPVEVRHYRVDWAAVDAPVLRQGDLAVQGVVLTPAQWPLEASLRRLLAGDFTGVVDGLDLSFHSSSIPSGVLRELYAEGYLPAYVRAVNEGAVPALFDPRGLWVLSDGDASLPAVLPEELPARFRRVDWAQTGAAIAAVALVAVLVVAGREGRGAGGVHGRIQVHPFVLGDSPSIRDARARDAEARRAAQPSATASGAVSHDPGLLRPETLAPGESREGFVLFAVLGGVADWRSARLALAP